MHRFVVRYLWTVCPHFGAAAGACAGMAGFGVWMVQLLPDDRGAPYVPLLFCQLFAASSGFRQAADAGHFDVLLVRGTARRAVGVAHWALSILPGLLAWAVIGLVEIYTTGSAAGFEIGAVTALLFVSTVAWAVSLAAARFVGGIVWVIAMGMVAVSPGCVAWIAGTLETGPPDSLLHLSSLVTAVVMVPVLLLVPAVDASVQAPAVIASVWLLSGGALVGGLIWICRRDFRGARR